MPLKAYIYPSNRLLYPFDDPAPDWRVLDVPLAEVQDKALTAAGLTPVRVPSRNEIPPDAGAHVALSDALYATPEALAAFLKAALSRGTSAQAVCAPGLFADRMLWHLPRLNDGVALPLYYDPGTCEPASHLVLPLDEDALDLPMPAHMGIAPGKGLEQLLTRQVLIDIVNWVNLYQANMQGLLAITQRAKKMPWWRGLWAVLRGRGTMFGTMAQLNRIGKGCQIHPTAVIELSEIGDGVQIGAHAVVRMSVVGKNAVIDDHASVRGTVVGEGATIANNNNVLLSVVYPRAFIISGPYQFSMFGYDTAIMHCICCDTRLDGFTVRAEIGPGESVDSKLRYLGTCYGHGVRAGAGTITAPGRAIPNHIHFLPNPGAVVGRVDPTLPRRKNLFTEGGGLTFKGRGDAPPTEVTLRVPQAASEQPEG